MVSIQRESLRLLALTETESLKEDFSSWIAELEEVNKKFSASPSDMMQEEKKGIEEEPEKKKKVEYEEYPGIQVKYQGQEIQISTLRNLDSIKNVSHVDGIILVFNETKEGVEKLQNLMSDVVKVLPPGFKQNILILLKQTDGGGVKLDMSVDERNLFRYQETEKTIENLLDRMITITKKHEIKRGLIEKAVMPVWKKEQYLKSFQKKREFSQKLFYFNYSFVPTKENFNILNESLRKSKFLTHVDIDFSETHIFVGDMKPQGDKIFKKFGESFRELSKLKVLKFKTLSDIGDKKLELLSENWKYFTSLETLHIQYHFTGDSQQFTTPGQKLDDCIKRFHSLKNLHLSLQRFHPDVVDLTDLACSLRRFSRLQGVHLDLRCLADAQPNEQTWRKFGDALKKITKLQTLKFRIFAAQQVEMIRWSVHYLCEALRELDSLKEISLDFNGTSITDEMVINLSQSLERHVSLQKITLIFPNCELTNEGLIRLNQTFARFNQLKSIFLNLNFCYEIDDHYLNNLGDSLVTLPSLENLKLWMIWCRKISEEALENFDQRLKTMKSLKDIVVRT